MDNKESSARLRVHLTPGTHRNEATSYVEGVLRVKVAAPPVKGQANKELIAFLADLLGVKKCQISIVRGEASRDKLLAIEGLSPEQLVLKVKAIQNSEKKLL